MGKRSREKQERRLDNGLQEKKNFAIIPEKVYFFIVEWGVYLALFTPLIFIKGFFFPFVSPKTIFFRIIVDIIFIAYIFLAVSNPKYRPRLNVLTLSIIFFLAIIIFTSFTGVNFARSFWSTFERMAGLLTFLHLFAFFIILTSCFRERKYWERILTVSILVGVIIGLNVLFLDNLSFRGGATLGNTSFMSAYLLFNIFFAISLVFAKSGFWRVLYGAALTIMLGALFFNVEPTRGAIGGLLGGMLILGFCYMMFSGKKMLKRLAPVILIFVILASIGISQTSFFKETVMDISDLPGESRKIVWKMGYEAWEERPLFGWGQENYNIPFIKYYNPGLFLTSDVWYDRVHNIVFDVAVTSGILGLVSYFAIFAVAIFSLLRTCLKVAEKRNLFLPLGMVALLLAYFFQNIWVFDMISSYMMFFLSLAFINFLISKPETANQDEQKFNLKPIYISGGALLVLTSLFTLYFGNIQPARASLLIIQGISSPPEKSIPAFQKALETTPMAIFEAPEQFSRRFTALTFNKKQDREVLKKGFEAAAKEMEKAIDKSPQDFRLYLLLGRHYSDFYFITRDPEKLAKAEIFLKKAIELGPRNPQGYWSLAQVKISQGRGEEAVGLLQKAIDLEPRFARSHWFLAMAYKTLGKYDLALGKLKDVEELGYDWRKNLEDLRKVIDLYQNLQDYKTTVSLYNLAIEMDSENAQFWAGAAVAYANLGQFDKAREYAVKAKELNSKFAPQIEDFLNSLPK
jgi:tetratricopeptide (TPR) repeat protein